MMLLTTQENVVFGVEEVDIKLRCEPTSTFLSSDLIGIDTD